MFYITTYPSPVGLLTLASDGTNLCGLWLEGQKYFGGSILKSASSETLRKELPVFSRTSDWLDRYFSEKSSTDFLIIFSNLRKCWKGLLYQAFPAFCVSEDTPHIMAFRSLTWR